MNQLGKSSEFGTVRSEDCSVPPGELDGLTIMRYAHISRQRESGGMEQYLRHLNRGLLHRHRLTVLQMHLTKDGAKHSIEVENVGIGRIVWVPVAARQSESRLADLPGRVGQIYTRTLWQHQQKGMRSYSALLSSLPSLLRHGGGHLRYKTVILSDNLANLLNQYSVDLLAIHWMSYDTDTLISHALKSKIPFVLINHFDNTQLSSPRMLRWAQEAAAVGAVSSQYIPDDLRDRYVNLSDAVDTEFFSRDKAHPLQVPPCPIVLLPARIDNGKGHRDALEALRILTAQRIDLMLCFAGAVDSETLSQELRDYASAAGMGKRFMFLGEKSPEEMRDWYAATSIVILPSYSEGLSRIILEAQAMKTPVIAYDSGGTREALLPNVTGFLISKGSVGTLVEKIRFLLVNQAERLRIGECGRDFVSRQFSISRLIQRHEAFYLRALSKHPQQSIA